VPVTPENTTEEEINQLFITERWCLDLLQGQIKKRELGQKKSVILKRATLALPQVMCLK
jgi:hypothetical protein